MISFYQNTKTKNLAIIEISFSSAEYSDLWPHPAANHGGQRRRSLYKHTPTSVSIATCPCIRTHTQQKHSNHTTQRPFVRAFVLPFLLFPWLRVWKWLPMRSTSLAWEQKQRGEHIITSQRKTESCLPVCLRRCVRTFSSSAAAVVSRGRRFYAGGSSRARRGRGKKTHIETEIEV